MKLDLIIWAAAGFVSGMIAFYFLSNWWRNLWKEIEEDNKKRDEKNKQIREDAINKPSDNCYKCVHCWICNSRKIIDAEFRKILNWDGYGVATGFHDADDEIVAWTAKYCKHYIEK